MIIRKLKTSALLTTVFSERCSHQAADWPQGCLEKEHPIGEVPGLLRAAHTGPLRARAIGKGVKGNQHHHTLPFGTTCSCGFDGPTDSEDPASRLSLPGAPALLLRPLGGILSKRPSGGAWTHMTSCPWGAGSWVPSSHLVPGCLHSGVGASDYVVGHSLGRCRAGLFLKK